MSESKIDIIYNTTVSKIQIVADTNVFVPALRSQFGVSYQLFSLIDEDVYRLNLSVSLALAEKIAALGAEDYLEIRAKRASKEKYQKAMSKVAKVEPPDYDLL
jgi:predicted nucleic acid-binding protein